MTNLRVLFAASLISLGSSMPVPAAEFAEIWRLGGFAMPESVSHDPTSGTLFVSNMNSPDMSANGRGSISSVSLDGKMLNEKFVDGLNAPKGTAVSGGKLYVVTIGELVEIDLATGKILNRYAAPSSVLLNDVASAEDGTIYITDTMQGAIYSLTDGALTQWLADPGLAGANGIVVNGDKLLVSTLGDMSGGFENMKPSNVKSVDIATKAVTDFGSAEPIGGLDGIELIDGGVTVTDHSGGRLVFVGSDGTIAPVGATGVGSADHEYVAGEDLVVIPMLQGTEIVAYRFTR